MPINRKQPDAGKGRVKGIPTWRRAAVFALIYAAMSAGLYTSAAAGPQQGLRFPSNNASGSDIRLNWSGANLLSRTSHTAIWKARYVQQSGYYAVTWHAENDGSFHFSKYEYGAHPYPTTGDLDETGQSTGATYDAGTVHYHEIAGLGEAPALNFGHDYIASRGGAPKLVVKGVWLTQARTVSIVGGTTLRHRFYPDVANDPTYVIEQSIPLSKLNVPVSPTFVIGCSPWTSSNFGGKGSGYRNNETPSAVIRSIKLFNRELSAADIATEAASGSNSAVTSAGRASVWYINENPTPSDVSDKSGAGHSPSWANANRPGAWTQ